MILIELLATKREESLIDSIKKQSNLSDISSEVKISLTKQEQKLIEILRNLDYGEIRILIKSGIPVHVEEIKKSIKL